MTYLARMVVRGVVLALCGGMLGACGDEGGGGSGRPDTGYGAGDAPSSTTPNCADLCARSADCFVHLCDEDTKSNLYDDLGPFLEDACQLNCATVDVRTKVSAEAWQCVFRSSCRQVFDQDVCHGMGSYQC